MSDLFQVRWTIRDPSIWPLARMKAQCRYEVLMTIEREGWRRVSPVVIGVVHGSPAYITAETYVHTTERRSAA